MAFFGEGGLFTPAAANGLPAGLPGARFSDGNTGGAFPSFHLLCSMMATGFLPAGIFASDLAPAFGVPAFFAAFPPSTLALPANA